MAADGDTDGLRSSIAEGEQAARLAMEAAG